MYYPYLRGKSNELLMLEEVCPLLATNQSVTPIIEPVRSNTARLERIINSYIAANTPLIVISNPNVGEIRESYESDLADVLALLPEHNDNSIIGYIISSHTTLDDIQHFIASVPNHQLAFIHNHPFSDPSQINQLPEINYHIFTSGNTSTAYQSQFSQSYRILVEDGFNQMRNADYPREEFFLDLHKTYQSLGFQGFGDFTITGEPYTEGGGAAHAVAIHLTYQDPINDLWVKHFISDRTHSAVDPDGKFLEALNKLVAFTVSNPGVIFRSTALDEYLDLQQRRHYPGLGFVKKLSMLHHVELMSDIVQLYI